jgi:hypothetical protein
LISDSGGAFTSNEFEAVCKRLGIDHKPMESTKGESYLNLMETHFNIPDSPEFSGNAPLLPQSP